MVKKETTYHNIRKENRQIPVSATGSNKKLLMNALCDIFLDAASQHFSEAEIFEVKERGKNYVWTLSKIFTRNFRLPVLKEEISIATWLKKTEKAHVIRDFHLFNESKQVLIGASTAYSLSDTVSGKTMKDAASLVEESMLEPSKHAVRQKFEKLSPVETPDTEIMIRAEYCDLDIHGFVKESKHVEWIMNLFPKKIHESKNIREFHLNIHDRLKIDERMNLKMRRHPDIHDMIEIEGNKENDGSCVLRGRVVWDENIEMD
ncbi:MAG: acyl-ACP thioesterase domain-containing protein [Bacteroidales bacterium]